MRWLAAVLVAGAVSALLFAIGWPPGALRWVKVVGPRGLEVRLVADGTRFMLALAKHVHEDAAAGALGVQPELEQWGVPGGSGADRTDAFLTGPDRQTLERVIESALAADPSIRLGEGQEIGYQHLHDKEGRWRTMVLDNVTLFTGDSVTDAEAATAPDTPGPFVTVSLDAEAARRLATITAANVGAKAAISVDGEICSVPVITGAITAGRLDIDTGATDPEKMKTQAYELLNAMRTGALGHYRKDRSVDAWTIAARAGCGLAAGLATIVLIWGVGKIRRKRLG